MFYWPPEVFYWPSKVSTEAMAQPPFAKLIPGSVQVERMAPRKWLYKEGFARWVHPEAELSTINQFLLSG